MHRVLTIIQKDIRLEWRQKYSLYGLLLYVVSAVFAIYMLQESPEGEVWNALYWLIILFVAVNAVAKSFLQESRHRNLYYYTLHHPRDIILSKLIYNVVLMMGMSLVAWFLFLVLLGDPAMQPGRFLLLVFSGGFSMALLFTLLAAIAGRAGGNSALIAILGFPLVVPQLILLSDLSRPLFTPMAVTNWWTFFGVLLLLDALIVALSLLLFPYLWKD
jgi:heme exporter protein B